MRDWFSSTLLQCVVAGSLVLFGAAVGIAQEQGHADAAAAHAAENAADHGPEHDLGHGNAGPKLTDASEFKTDLAVYTFVVFLLLLVILSKFAWPPIVRALEARERHIADNIAAAEDKHEEAKKVLAAHEAKLAGAADEVRELLEQARRNAEQAKNEIIAEARRAAEEERLRGVREVKLATAAAMKTLAETSVNTAIDLAGKVVREKLNPDEQQAIVRDALQKLASSSPSEN